MTAESAPTDCHENAICDLVLAAQEGDQHAFGELLEQHRGMVYTTVFGVLRHHGDAEDVCQDVFFRAWMNIKQVSDQDRFSGWLETIAINTAINKTRSKKRKTLGIDAIEKSVGKEPMPLTAAIDDEDKKRLRQALRRLHDQDQDILIAFYFDSYSLPEISCQLQKPLGTIKRRLHDARHRLEKELRLMGFGADEHEPPPRKERKTPEWACRVTFPLPAVTSSFAPVG